MDHWLDSLSEDWVSQPASSRSGSIQNSSVRRDASSPTSTGSQSRIPRYKPRTVSNLSIAGEKEQGQEKLLQRDSSRDAALKEKTLSNLNASHASHKRFPKGQVKSQSPDSEAGKLRLRQTSTESVPSALQDTVQCKISPAKNVDTQATPEWKRRMLKENLGKADLFSPIRLENVFKPPTVGLKLGPKAAAKNKPPNIDGFPSSPPPYSTLARRKSNTPKEIPNKRTNSLSPPTEVPEGGSTNNPRSIQKGNPASPHFRNRDFTRVDKRPLNPRASSDAVVGRSRALPTGHARRGASPTDDHSIQPTPDGLENSKTSSTLDKSRDENISPLYVSKHNTVDGGIEYGVIDMSMRRLRSQMDKLRQQQQNIPSSRSSDHDFDHAESKISERSSLPKHIGDVTSQSLPDDLSMGTDAYAANGGFVSIRRGGYSNDGSFQRRPLSPSLLQQLDGPSFKSQRPKTPESNPSPKLSQHPATTDSRKLSSPPKTPNHHKEENSGSHERPKSSGSPLKLFDKYDTYTNDRLARRMNKFEETLQQDLPDDIDLLSARQPSSPSPGPKKTRRRITNEQRSGTSGGGRISSFGDGELNEYQFPVRPPTDRDSAVAQHGKDKDYCEASKPISDGFRFEHLTSDHFIGDNDVSLKHPDFQRHDLTGDQGNRRQEVIHFRDLPTKAVNRPNTAVDYYQQEAIHTTTGKRLPYSPVKDPSPKRRRTLRSSEETDQKITCMRQQLDAKETSSQAKIGRKRKDALYDTDHQVANPHILAMRQIRLPRLPTSSQANSPAPEKDLRGADQVQNEYGAGDEVPENSIEPGQDTIPAVDPPTQIVAGALATIALNTVQDITHGSRKASVTTADFFNEAQQIMQLIRNQGRPKSSHTPIEGSETGHPTIIEESVIEDSTKDEFSRPPSREGGSPTRLREPAHIDARVVSHLRKFEDKDELGFALSSSFKSLHIRQSRESSQQMACRLGQDEVSITKIESDPPNVRILESNAQAQKRRSSFSAKDVSNLGMEKHAQSRGSQSTSGPSTNRSNPTSSSRSSTNKFVIAPETVAHLLSDQMAGMVFDRQRQVWVKRKGSANVENNGNPDHTASEGTEEDLFGDIPDLSVDEMEELKRVKEAVSSIRSMSTVEAEISRHDHLESRPSDRSKHLENVRPKTADGKEIEAVEASSAPSKCSNFAWSGPMPGTRATSYGEEVLPPKQPPLQDRTPAVVFTNIHDEHAEEVEHEISILEGRQSRIPRHQSSKQRQARVVTVAFSSPLVEQMDSAGIVDEGDLELWEEQSAMDSEESPSRYNPRPTSSGGKRTSIGIGRRSSHRGASRRVSIGNQSYLARPMSRLDEQEEMSLVQCSVGDRQMSMDVAISTPLPLSKSFLAPPTTGQRSSIGFQLTPLPDFTVHQIDKQLDGDGSQVSRNCRLFPMQQYENRISLAAQDLIKNLTDMEPYEPYWDYIRSVNLRDRNLKTLHMLDELCGRVEQLDVSDNQIGELNGIPDSVRQLNIRGNCLSDLAAWHSLYNLQYMDVSNNSLQCLKGFHSLIHLRTLKADNNQIDSLSGVEDLDGLISLSLRGNRLRIIDFRNFNL